MSQEHDNSPGVEGVAAADILKALSVGTSALLNAECLADAMPELLCRLGTAVDVSRAYLFDVEEDAACGFRIWQRFEWCAEGVASEIDNPALQGSSFAEIGFERWQQLMVAGQPVFGVVEDFPESERSLLSAQGIRSLACLPIQGDGRLSGFIGFDDCVHARQWTQPELDALHTAADLIGAAKQRFNSEYRTRERDRLFRILAEQTSDIIAMGDAGGVLSYISPSVRQSLGYAPESLLGTSIYDYQHPDDTDRFIAELYDPALGKLSERALSSRMRHQDGRWIWMETRLNATFDDEGSILHWVAASRDISERRQFEEQLASQRERALATLGSIADGVIAVDADGRVEYLNPAAEMTTGFNQGTAHGRPVYEVLRPDSPRPPPSSAADLAHIAEWYQGFGSNPFGIVERGGGQRTVQLSMAPIRSDAASDEGSTRGMVLTFRDTSQTAALLRELAYRASHDSLTGLYNREEFDRQLKQLVQEAANNGSEHALCYIDLDQFKLVNDTCGHRAGDALLKEVSESLRSRLVDGEILARLGGDEFGVLIPFHSAWEAARRAQDLLDRLARLRFEWNDRLFSVGGSIGVAPVNQDSGDPESVLMAADAACYVAKERGRNRVHVFEPSDVDMARRQGEMRWIPRLQTALEVDDFVLFAHDIVPMAEGRPSGRHFEVLIALPGASGKLIPPGEFLPAAQRYGLMGRIDRWVVSKVVSWMLDRQARQAPELRMVAVNLSGSSVSDPEFRDFVEEQVALLRQPDWLCFEITESEAVANLSEAREFIQRMHSYGCRFALDDFGAGLSSFAYLKRLPVDVLKIDGQFVRDIRHDQVNWAMVEAISHVARVMGLKTVAEFVEDESIFEACRQIGLDYCQGFHFGRPVPLTAIT